MILLNQKSEKFHLISICLIIINETERAMLIELNGILTRNCHPINQLKIFWSLKIVKIETTLSY